MFFLNLIIILITLIYQFYNTITLTKSLTGANKFLFMNTKNTPETRKLVKSLKVKLLQTNRIIFLITIVVSIILVIFNRSVIITSIYVVVFLLLPFLYERYYIDKCLKTLKNENHLLDDQDIKPIFFDIVYNDKDGDNFYEYGLKRYMINIGTLVGKLFSIMIIAIITAFLALIIIYAKPDSEEIQVSASVSGTALIIEYDNSKKEELQFSDITSIEKKPALPKLEGDIKGVDDGSYLLGAFSTKDYDEARLFVYKDAPTFLVIKTTNGKYYIFSEEDQAASNTIFEKIQENIPKDKAPDDKKADN